MRFARTRPPSPRFTHSIRPASMPSPFSNRSTHPEKALSLSTPSEPSSSRTRYEQSNPTLPVIRWLTGKHKVSSPKQSPVQSRPSTPLAPGPPSSSAVSALADALHDDPHLMEVRSHSVDLPSRPQAARLPPAFQPSRPPGYLTHLTHSILPTAWLLPPPTASVYQTTYTDPFDDPFARSSRNEDLDLLYSPTPIPLAMPHSPLPAHLNRSPPTLSPSPTRSSIDTLRSIKERGLHTSAPAQRLNLPSLPDSLRGWFSSEDNVMGKENADLLLDDADKGADSEAQREQIRKHYAAPKNPVVFCHGLLGFDTVTLGPSIAPLQVAHWRGIKDVLESNGIEVLITRVPATSSPIDRAKVLEEKISSVYPGRSVHLIGHSMGGLDCRYLTTHLKKRRFKVLSITTIASPHRGSSFADYFLSTVGRERMPSVLSLLDMLPNGGGDGKAFEFLSVANMRKFNEETPDVPGVKYFSWGAMYEPGLIDTWKWSHSVIMEKEGPNDGLVSLKSAKWGTYLGTLEGVNHLDLVGWVNTARYKWAKIMGREIKFKPATFYLSIADNLARVVEEQEPEQEVPEADVSSTEREEREEIRRKGERAAMAESLGKGEERRPGKSAKIVSRGSGGVKRSEHQ